MQRSLRLSLSLSGVAALALANTPLLPATAQEADTAEHLGGVMSISLADVVKPTIGVPAPWSEPWKPIVGLTTPTNTTTNLTALVQKG